MDLFCVLSEALRAELEDVLCGRGCVENLSVSMTTVLLKREKVHLLKTEKLLFADIKNSITEDKL